MTTATPTPPMDRRQEPRFIPAPIVAYTTNKAFLNVHDALSIGKIKIEVASYDGAKQTGLAGCYINYEDALLVARQIGNGQFPSTYPSSKFEKYSGSASIKIQGIESRYIKIAYDPTGGGSGDYSRAPWLIEVRVGPGKKGPTGAVMPDNTRKAEFRAKTIRVPHVDMLRHMLMIETWIQAWMTSHFDEIQAAAKEELRRRLNVDPHLVKRDGPISLHRPDTDQGNSIGGDERDPSSPHDSETRRTAREPSQASQPARW